MTPESIWITLLLWTLFGFQHSFLAQPIFKRLIVKGFGQRFLDYAYRFFYFSSQCIVYPCFWYIVSRFESGRVLWVVPESLYAPYQVIKIFGHFVLLFSVLSADVNTFVGTKPLFVYLKSKIFKTPLPPVPVFGESSLVVTFPFNIIRHPMYFGITVSLLTSTTVFSEKVILNLICLLAYIEIGTYFEEKQLVKIFGHLYQDYQKRVPKFIPLIR